METMMSGLMSEWFEYLVVAVMLFLSALIGAYYTFFNRQVTFNDYMFGNKSMGVLPISLSVVVSFVSAITMVGFPVEVYLYGTQVIIACLSHTTSIIFSSIFFLPIYFKLQLNSVFEYLELRFDYRIRILGTGLYSLAMVIVLPSIIYAPALVLNQVSGFPVFVVVPILTFICIFYTTCGGLKAVVWTDAIQSGFMLLAVMLVAVIGSSRLGGFQEIIQINREGSRLEAFVMDPNPFVRHSFWTVYIGYTFMYLTTFGLSPGMVQRYLAVSSLKKARMVLLLTAIGFALITCPCIYLGMILYARYHQCDPVAAGQIKSHNSLVPLFLTETKNDYPGLTGLFLSGVLSAALSTISSWLNTVAGTVYKDVMDVFWPHVKHSDSKQSNIIKLMVVILGIGCMALVFLVEKLGSLLQMSVTVNGIVYGSLMTLFCLGIFFPQANVKGAFAGTLTSLLLAGWITFNSQYYFMQGKLQYPGKVTSIDHCPSDLQQHFNSSSTQLFTYRGEGTQVVADSSVHPLYTISYTYVTVIGTVAGLIIGIIVSLLTEPPNYAEINPDVFSSYVHMFLPSCKHRYRSKDRCKLTTKLEKHQHSEAEEFVMRC